MHHVFNKSDCKTEGKKKNGNPSGNIDCAWTNGDLAFLTNGFSYFVYINAFGEKIGKSDQNLF